MGSLRLFLSHATAENRRVVASIHMVRIDSVPWPARLDRDGNVITLSRNVQPSGYIVAAYPVLGVGEIALRTGTLPESERPYVLAVELARGTLDRLRQQVSLWEEGGLRIPAEVKQDVDRAIDRLVEAVLDAQRDPEQRIAAAEEVLEISCRAIDRLCREFVDQVRRMRLFEPDTAPLLGVRVEPGELAADWLDRLLPSFRVVQLSCWSPPPADEPPPDCDAMRGELDRRQRKTIAGPIWDAGARGLPPPILQIPSFEAKRAAAHDHFLRILNSIQRPPDWLLAASGLNGIGNRFFTFPQQMQVVVDILQLIDDFDRRIPLLISFDQPWGERLAWSVGGAHALQVADLLLRHDVRLSGLGLEVNLDYWPHGSLLRDPLQWLELVDVWSQFGLPLFLFLRAPSGFARDEVVGSGADRTMTIRASVESEQVAHYLDTVVSLLLLRPTVQAVVWNQYRDAADHPFPAAGLYDRQGDPKPIYYWMHSVAESVTGSPAHRAP